MLEMTWTSSSSCMYLEPEALFVSDNFDLIEVSTNNKFQILSQVEMAKCIK
jgi:hypothetical protein